ncbi:glycosyltransferase family 2 protein [Streptomyces sp. NPDC086549]|uniref:glycosyltransferase family 2 protein n=1 Tax=Streptomyces sp. NPDC086549 TaxID=3365752 RepID=UPI0038300AB9
MSSTPLPVAVITYGHPPDMVREALSPALKLQADGFALTPWIVDDCSGRAPRLPGVNTVTTPGNGGYAAAVNFAATTLAADAERIVFVNPDASMDLDAFRALVTCRSRAAVVVPSIPHGPRLENVRRVLTASQVLLMLVLPRLARQALLPRAEVPLRTDLGSGWVPAGTIASFDAAHLRAHPLRPEMFWIEMSSWARDNPRAGVEVLPVVASHTGASSKEQAAAKVTASQLAAYTAYLHAYGNPMERALLPVAFVLGRLVQLACRRLSVRGTAELFRLYRGESSWQSIRTLR